MRWSSRTKYQLLPTPYDEKQFYLEEYKLLRSEIELHLTERRRLEAQVFLGVFALYAWLFSLDVIQDKVLFRIGLGLPIIVVLIGFLRWTAIQTRTMLLASYLKEAESKLLPFGQLGWESYLSDKRRNRVLRGNFEGWAEALSWAILFALTLVVYSWRFHASIFFFW